MRVLHRLAGLLSAESGSALMMTAAAMPLLIGSAGMAADTIQWTLWKRQLQRAADTGALAGAYAKGQDKTVSAAVSAAIAKDSDLTIASTTVQNAPTAGAFAGNTQAVRVILTTGRRLPFSSFFITTPTISAEATAAILSNGHHCVIALEDSTTAGIEMEGNATVNLGCGMATNSSAANAVTAGGSASIIATPITAVGGLQSSSNYLSPTTLQPYSLEQPDPFAALPTPSASDFLNCNNELSVNSNQVNNNVQPGCYKGMDLKGTVTLQPGVYFIDGSTNKDFKIGAQANVTGQGVTIILTSSNAVSNPGSIATADINGGATINLTATTSGTYSGVLLYQDRRAEYDTVVINGNSSSTLQGGIYFPKQKVQFLGTAGMNTSCVQIVGLQVKFSGNSTINNQCPVGSNTHSFIGSVVRLVA